MNIKETIRAEIERREKIIRNSANQISDSEKKTYYSGCADALLELLPFLDTLPEQPVEGLEEAANDYCIDVRLGYPRVMDETDRYIYNAFIAGAKWQKKLDDDGAAVRAAAIDLAGKLEKYLKQDCTRFVLCQSLNNLKSLLHAVDRN